MRRRLGEPDVARDDGPVDLVAEVLLELRGDVQRQRVARVVHRAQQPLDLERGIEVRAHLLHRLHEVRQAFERVVLALHRDQHAVRGAQAVQREQRQRRRAIEQDEVVVAGHLADRRLHLRQRLGERVLEARFALGQLDELDLGAGELAVRGHEVEAAGRRHDAHVRDLPLAEQHLVDGRVEGALVDARAGRRVALRVEVHEEHAAVHRDETGREVDRGRRLADAALLVRNRDDSRGGHEASPRLAADAASRTPS